MPAQRALVGARFSIPQTDRFVIAAGGDDRSVGRKGHGIDVFAAYSLKQLVLTLLAFLVQILLPVPVTVPWSLVPWTGFLGLKALTDGPCLPGLRHYTDIPTQKSSSYLWL